jgi:hypothetical protein
MGGSNDWFDGDSFDGDSAKGDSSDECMVISIVPFNGMLRTMIRA